MIIILLCKTILMEHNREVSNETKSSLNFHEFQGFNSNINASALRLNPTEYHLIKDVKFSTFCVLL